MWPHDGMAIPLGVQAAMLNPALLAAVTAAAATEYKRAAGGADAMAVSVPGRAARSCTAEHGRRCRRRRATRLGNWVAQNPIVHAGIGARAQSLAGAGPGRAAIRA